MLQRGRYQPLDPALLLERLGVRFERRGKWFWASCPHPGHRDSSPSWRLNADPSDPKVCTHKCFGCGAWGGPAALVEWVLGCGREEALEWLRDVDGQAPPLPLEPPQVVEVGNRWSGFRLPLGMVQAPVEEWPEEPRDYLLNERGVEPWQVERWGLGYAPRGWHEQDNPLAGRIVFPVRNSDGILLYYTGRAYDGSKRRYKEPGKSEGAYLGAVFGEQYWPSSDREVLVVTEGALDALAVERVSDLPVGGLFGSQLHQGHVLRLSTWRRLITATDPDQAGDKVIGLLAREMPRTVTIERLRLPEGEDCASVPREVLAAALERVMFGKRARARHY